MSRSISNPDLHVSKLPPTPHHARLLAEVEELRQLADKLIRRQRRHPHVRPTSTEATYLRYVASALEHAAGLFTRVELGDGRLELSYVDAGDWSILTAPVLALRPPPARVIDLAEERKRRAAGR